MLHCCSTYWKMVTTPAVMMVNWKYDWRLNMQPIISDLAFTITHASFNQAIGENLEDACLAVLLRWGFHSVTTIKLSAKPDRRRRRRKRRRPSLFRETAVELCLKSMTLITKLYPQCLQENWFVYDDIPEELWELSNQSEEVFIY